MHPALRHVQPQNLITPDVNVMDTVHDHAILEHDQPCWYVLVHIHTIARHVSVVECNSTPKTVKCAKGHDRSAAYFERPCWKQCCTYLCSKDMSLESKQTL